MTGAVHKHALTYKMQVNAAAQVLNLVHDPVWLDHASLWAAAMDERDYRGRWIIIVPSPLINTVVLLDQHTLK